MKQNDIYLFSYCVRKVGDGASTRLREDTWCVDLALKTIFPRIYLLDMDKQCFVKNRVPFKVLSSTLRRHPCGGVEMAQIS